MEILFGFAVATVLAIGWFYGNLFVCVFLTLFTLCGIGFGIALVQTGSPHPEMGTWLFVVSLAALCVTWAPRYYRQHTMEQV